jgi:hypothetical protein
MTAVCRAGSAAFAATARLRHLPFGLLARGVSRHLLFAA